jgi:DNA repair exonuclease SbcCD nuclease subunit
MTLRDVFRRLSQIAPVVAIAGNHDAASFDVDILDEPERDIHVCSRPEVSIIGAGNPMVAMLPWPSKAYLLQQMEETGLPLDELCRQAMKAILRGFAMRFAEHSGPRLIVAHLNVLGAAFGNFTPLGQDVEVTVEDLELTGADYIALGHIHRQQQLGPHVFYSGSLARTDFGEENEVKAVLLVEVERDQLPKVTVIETPTRRMQTLEVDLADPFALEGKRFLPDAQARLILRLTEDERAGLDMPRLLEQLGAKDHVDLKIDMQVTPRGRVRSAAIQQARTDADRLDAYLNTLEPAIDSETRERLHQKLVHISAESTS